MSARLTTADHRLARARAEIARRRELAEQATPGPWAHDDRAVWQRGGEETVIVETWLDVPDLDLPHIAANDPAHVLAVLAAADATLDRHARTHLGDYLWPHLVCADAKLVLDIYAPEHGA